jgi:hypothetical protein
MEARRADLHKLRMSELRKQAIKAGIDKQGFDDVIEEAEDKAGKMAVGIDCILAAEFPQGVQAIVTRSHEPDADASSSGANQPVYWSYETHRVQLADHTKAEDNDWPQHTAAHMACILYHPRDTSELHLHADIAAIQKLMPAFNREERPSIFDIVPVESKSHLLRDFRDHIEAAATRKRTAFFVFWAGRACRCMRSSFTHSLI